MAHITHIEAEVYLLSPEEGGRKNYLSSGCWPKFYINGQGWGSEMRTFDGTDMLPGNTYAITLGFLAPELLLPQLSVGDAFELHEVTRTIGRGRVTVILGV